MSVATEENKEVKSQDKSEKATKKAKELNSELDALVAARVKDGLENIAPPAIELAKSLGVVTPDGSYKLRDGVLDITYNELLDVLTISTGPNLSFACNLTLKRVTTYKNGSWNSIFAQLVREKLSNTANIKYKQQFRIREQMGLPR